MTWSDTTDPGDASSRHTYGAERGLTTRVLFGDYVRFGGPGFEDTAGDPSDTWSDITDPSDN